LLVLFVVGCGGRVLEMESASESVADAATETANPNPAVDAKEPAPIIDATTPTPTDAGPAPVVSLAECFGEMGSSNPSTLKDLLYDWSYCPGGDITCMGHLRFNFGCAMELRRGDSSTTRVATASKDDCDVLRRWATSERLLRALDPMSLEAAACRASEDGTRPESTMVGGTGLALKTYTCAAEPFITNRRCLQVVISRYFPPK